MKASNDDVLQLVKPRAAATILFCNLRGYAQLASATTLEQIVDRLNTYFSVVTELVNENHGTVAKFVGDAVMVYWLAEEQPDHAALACRLASSLPGRLSAAPFDMTTTIGIHTGNVAFVEFKLGNNRGPEPMGDSVNMTSRLEALCGHYKAKAIASEAVITSAGSADGWTLLDSVNVKGRDEQITLYGIL